MSLHMHFLFSLEVTYTTQPYVSRLVHLSTLGGLFNIEIVYLDLIILLLIQEFI